MIKVPVVILREAYSWVDCETKWHGCYPLIEKIILGEILKEDTGSARISVAADKVERIRDWIKTQAYLRYQISPSIVKQLDQLLSEYYRKQDLLKVSGPLSAIKYFLKWGFRGL